MAHIFGVYGGEGGNRKISFQNLEVILPKKNLNRIT